MADLSEPKFAVRICCVAVSVAINIALCFTLTYKVLYKKQKQCNVCILLCASYLLFAVITPSYNIYYRFVVEPSDCFVSDTIEECLVVFTRCLLLFFYVSRLQSVFSGSSHAISTRFIVAICLFILAYSIIIPLLWIPTQTVSPQSTQSFGTYCSNTGNLVLIGIYFLCDFVATTILAWSFIFKLLAVRTNTDDSIENEVQKLQNRRLLQLAEKTLILTLLSIISTALIMYPSYLTNSELRWFYPLDYGINGMCIFFMFNWTLCEAKSCNICCCFELEKYLKENDSDTDDQDDSDMYKDGDALIQGLCVEEVARPEMQTKARNSLCHQDMR